MEELIAKIQEIIRDETRKIVRDETEEIKAKLDSIDDRVTRVEDEVKSLRGAMFTMENDYFKKIDIMYDYILFQKEMNDIKFSNVAKMGETVQNNELKILNHETRIECLENNLNQSV